tara:strand:- start:42 stop:389 length:348 start_codon:yes stop_codon:yes gene_type:complete
MSEPLRIAVVGVGRIGAYRALHVQELANKERNCVLTAVVDSYQQLAARANKQLHLTKETEVLTMPTVAELEHFIKQCTLGEPFCVDQNDGLRALEIVGASQRSVRSKEEAIKIDI